MEKAVEQYAAYCSWTREHRNSRFEIDILKLKKLFSYYVHFIVLYRYMDMWLGHRSLCSDYATGFESREVRRYFFCSPKCPDRFGKGGGVAPGFLVG